MKFKGFALSLLALSVASTGLISGRALAAQEGDQDHHHDDDHDRWDAPPHEFREIQRRGFHDGIEGARRDFDHHRAPNVEGREEFRHPHVEESARDDYREGFRRGYDSAMRHMMGEQGR